MAPLHLATRVPGGSSQADPGSSDMHATKHQDNGRKERIDCRWRSYVESFVTAVALNSCYFFPSHLLHSISLRPLPFDPYRTVTWKKSTVFGFVVELTCDKPHHPTCCIVLRVVQAPEADLKWGGHGLSEVSWAPKGSRIRGPGDLSREKLKIKTEMLISGHFSGYSELHRTRIIIYAHAWTNCHVHVQCTCTCTCTWLRCNLPPPIRRYVIVCFFACTVTLVVIHTA